MEPKIKPAKARRAKAVPKAVEAALAKVPKPKAKPKAVPTKGKDAVKPKRVKNTAPPVTSDLKALEDIKFPVSDPVQATHFEIKIGNRLVSNRLPTRVSALVLPLESSKQDRRESVLLKLSIMASPQDPFGDQDMAALAKGPLMVSIIGHDTKTLGSKTYTVDQVQREQVKYDGQGLDRFGLSGNAIVHHYQLEVKIKTAA